MRLAMITAATEVRPAAQLRSGEFLDVRAAHGAGLVDARCPSSVVEILRDPAVFDALRRLTDDTTARGHAGTDRLRAAGALRSAADVVLCPPVRPSLMLCTGGTYREHLREMGAAMPTTPRSFVKTAPTIIGARDPIKLPAVAPQFIDFECEFACVFSRPCHGVSPGEAMHCVGGYTMINDVSARDDVAAYLAAVKAQDVAAAGEAWDRVLLGKQFPTFCPLGPVVTTSDELSDPHNVRIQTRVNGVTMQDANTGDLAFPIAETIAYFSRFFAFEPGDVLSTGSPSGVGAAHTPPVFLRPGDVVEVEGEYIGMLSNAVVAAR